MICLLLVVEIIQCPQFLAILIAKFAYATNLEERGHFRRNEQYFLFWHILCAKKKYTKLRLFQRNTVIFAHILFSVSHNYQIINILVCYCSKKSPLWGLILTAGSWKKIQLGLFQPWVLCTKGILLWLLEALPIILLRFQVFL